MAKRTDIQSILIIGAGPIIIGQACEFDYSGTQACKALRKLGYEIVLVNSNPATIMTDPETADVTYIEPLNAERLEEIIAKERPDALLPNLGGQSGLNLCEELYKKGILDKYNVKVIGVQVDSIERGEDRIEFKKTMDELGIEMARSEVAYSVEDGLKIADKLGYPVVLRPAYTMGGAGGGLVYNKEELKTVMARGLQASLVGQVLVEESILGWEELELEVVRDAKNNMITICFIENIDPLGVHTGDSFCSAPMLTISKEVQNRLQEQAYRIVESIGVIGGTNVQFAHDPVTDRIVVIEINPRTSRSSALASKATGYPIAKLAAKIALGYTLDEIKNAVTGKTYASYEPTLDYVVCKIPKWPFDKFVYGRRKLGTQMKATGEVMAIGRNFEQALMKAVRGAEISQNSLNMKKLAPMSVEELREKILAQDDERLFAIYESFKRGVTVAEIHELTKIDEWFLNKLMHILSLERRMQSETLSDALYMEAKQNGFPDAVIKEMTGLSEIKHVPACYRMVDTCSAEFTASTPYFYSTFGEEDEAEEFIKENASGKPVVMVFGSGPIRIGQGIEFDFASVHCVWSLKRAGYEVVIVNNNPETVSTDFNVADRLYFEPLTPEDVLDIIRIEKSIGAVVAFGGQTAIRLTKCLVENNIPVLGTPADSIDMAEDRGRFAALLKKLNMKQAAGQTVYTEDEAIQAANHLGYPVLMRPSYVLGGQNMIIAHSDKDIVEYMAIIMSHMIENPVLIDKYMMGTEVEVDAICDGTDFLIPGIMEHVERAGIHSGDSISIYPAQNLNQKVTDTIVRYTGLLAKELHAVGLINIQYVVYNNEVYVIEVNPRSSRTVPYISKVTGIPMVDLATKIMLGETLKSLGYESGLYPSGDYVAVKVPVFSFEKLQDVDTMLGPEMKSTGECLGIGRTFEDALLKGLIAAGYDLKKEGGVLISVRDSDKQEIIPIADRLSRMGFELYGTSGTANVLNHNMIATNLVRKISEGEPNTITLLESGKIHYMISTSEKGRMPARDSVKMRRKSVERSICCLTAIDTASALSKILESGRSIDDVELVDITKI